MLSAQERARVNGLRYKREQRATVEKGGPVTAYNSMKAGSRMIAGVVRHTPLHSPAMWHHGAFIRGMQWVNASEHPMSPKCRGCSGSFLPFGPWGVTWCLRRPAQHQVPGGSDVWKHNPLHPKVSRWGLGAWGERLAQSLHSFAVR